MGALVRFLLPSPFCFSSYLRQDVFFFRNFTFVTKYWGKPPLKPGSHWKIERSVKCNRSYVKYLWSKVKYLWPNVKYLWSNGKYLLSNVKYLWSNVNYFLCYAKYLSFLPSSARNYGQVLKAPDFGEALGCWKGKGWSTIECLAILEKIIKNRMNFHERLHVCSEYESYFQWVVLSSFCQFWKICILCWAPGHKSSVALADISNTENADVKHTRRNLSPIYL